MADPFHVLVFSKTTSYRHESIPAGIAAFRRLAEASKTTSTPFDVEASEDAEAIFTTNNLARYRVVVLLQNSGNFLDGAQLGALKTYVLGGKGGVVGIHCASSALQSSEIDPEGFYGRLLGAAFSEHPAPQLGRVIIKDPKHPVVSALLAKVSSATEATPAEPSFSYFDEWYNYKLGSCSVATAAKTAAGQPTTGPEDVHILLTVDETTYEGGKHGDDHPIAWTWPNFENTGTRVFYTALGHFDAAYEDEPFVQHLHNAVLWAAKHI